jgi:GxxExxY protein
MMFEDDYKDSKMHKMNTDEINKLTHKIIGCAMEVHNQLGNGFQEVIYQRSLAIEFGLQGLSFQRELEMELFYKGEQVGTRRVDFFVESKVMVEIKAIEKLEGVHKAQAINYCEAYHIADGLLINFGAVRLEYHRVFNKKLKS